MASREAKTHQQFKIDTKPASKMVAHLESNEENEATSSTEKNMEEQDNMGKSTKLKRRLSSIKKMFFPRRKKRVTSSQFFTEDQEPDKLVPQRSHGNTTGAQANSTEQPSIASSSILTAPSISESNISVRSVDGEDGMEKEVVCTDVVINASTDPIINVCADNTNVICGQVGVNICVDTITPANETLMEGYASVEDISHQELCDLSTAWFHDLNISIEQIKSLETSEIDQESFLCGNW